MKLEGRSWVLQHRPHHPPVASGLKSAGNLDAMLATSAVYHVLYPPEPTVTHARQARSAGISWTPLGLAEPPQTCWRLIWDIWGKHSMYNWVAWVSMPEAIPSSAHLRP